MTTTGTARPARSELGVHWDLDPTVVFLNHGSFGACPRAVLARQTELRAQLEREPVRFFVREYPGLLEQARAALGAFVGAAPDDLAFVPNATTGVSTVLASLDLQPGDEVLTTDHAYGACKNALDALADARGLRVVVARVPFPLDHADRVIESVVRAVSKRTKLALLDLVTSPTGLVLPIGRLVAELATRGVDSLVDAAHAPGMVPLALDTLGAAYTTGNLHKWVCTPKGAAFLHVRKDRQARLRPLVTSHGRTAPLGRSTRFRHEHDWTGTDDPTAWLVLADAIAFMAGLVPGGWSGVRQRNRALALAARRTLCDALGVPAPAPEDMIGTLAAVPLPDAPPGAGLSPLGVAPLQDALFARGIEVPVFTWSPAEPDPTHRPVRIVRVSAQLYNAPAEYAHLARELQTALAAEQR